MNRGIGMVDIGIPPEPRDVKEFIKGFRQRVEEMEDSRDYEWMDFLAVWYRNKLPKYLWSSWKNELAPLGYSWQKFLRIMRLHAQDFILWAIYDKLTWNELISKICETLERYKTVK